MRRTPFDMFTEMDRMFDQMRRSMWQFDESEAGDAGSRGGSWYAFDSNVSLEKTDDGFVALSDLPGFEKEEIDLRFDDGRLHVSATHEVSGDGVARSRRVDESVTVPGEILVEDVSATYRNGVLEVHLPTVGDEADEDTVIDVE